MLFNLISEPSDTIWQHWSQSSMVHVMAYWWCFQVIIFLLHYHYRKCSRYLSIIWVWKSLIKSYNHILQEWRRYEMHAICIWIVCNIHMLNNEMSLISIPDSKVHGANMGPTWADRTQVGPMLAPWTLLSGMSSGRKSWHLLSFQGPFY